jgi:hypothetical protein
MPVRVTLRYLLAFAALVLVSSELHEQAHITVGRLVCGCYGPRDFNVWTTGTPCANPSLTVLASLAGPLFSYALMAMGAWMLARGEGARRAAGWALVFAPLPFARLFTAAMGGGDERTALRMLWPDVGGAWSGRLLAFAIVASLAVPPLVVAWRSLRGDRRWLSFVGFLLAPMLFSFVWAHLVMNRILEAGILDETLLLGTPSLVLLHALAALAVVAALAPHLASPADATGASSRAPDFATPRLERDRL